jgi:branched-chain amino acid transport system ATP-binding protein
LSLLGRKRLELARAMATGPKLLLLDEIAGGLTEGECHALVETIKGVLATGVTVVWIEHVLHALTRWWNGFWCSTSARSSPSATRRR